MAVLEPVTERVVERLIETWFDALDLHRPIEHMLAMLADDGLNMRFPGVQINGHGDFALWYDDVVRQFFDERHEIHRDTLKIDTHGPEVVVDLVVGWQASSWDAPAARSRRVVMDATQRWTVRESRNSPVGIEIVTYVANVEPFRFSPGFSRLAAPAEPEPGSHGRAARYLRVPHTVDTRGNNYARPCFPAAPGRTLTDKRVLIMTADGPELPEIDVPLDYLRTRGAHVLVAGQDWVFQYREPAGYVIISQWLADERCIRADIRLSDVDITQFDALFIPGGAWNPDMLRTDPQALRIVREARAKGILIVSVCHGPQILINATTDESIFPRGTRVTGVESIQQDLRNAGFSVHEQDPTAYDERTRLLTARGPDDLGRLCEEMERLLSTAL